MAFPVDANHTSTNSVYWSSAAKAETNNETNEEKRKKINIFGVAAAATAGAYMSNNTNTNPLDNEKLPGGIFTHPDVNC